MFNLFKNIIYSYNFVQNQHRRDETHVSRIFKSLNLIIILNLYFNKIIKKIYKYLLFLKI